MADTKKKVNPIQFLAQVRQEARKVTWTTGREVWVTTIMVMIVVAITSLFFFAVDTVLSNIVGFLLNLIENTGG